MQNGYAGMKEGGDHMRLNCFQHNAPKSYEKSIECLSFLVYN